MSLKLNSSGGGSVTLQEPVTASARTLTLPDNTGTVVSTASTAVVSQAMLASGVAGTGPAFSVSRTTSQSVSTATWTKVSFNTEEFDTGNVFDLANSRFTPNVAGYYQINGTVAGGGSVGTLQVISQIYKNGGSYKAGTSFIDGTLYGSYYSTVTSVVYLNGTTDYIELFAYVNGSGSMSFLAGSNVLYLNGVLVRAA